MKGLYDALHDKNAIKYAPILERVKGAEYKKVDFKAAADDMADITQNDFKPEELQVTLAAKMSAFEDAMQTLQDYRQALVQAEALETEQVKLRRIAKPHHINKLMGRLVRGESRRLWLPGLSDRKQEEA